ncbi:MAG TPA: hypothetical protein PKC43_07390 [Phycisphaerales bacterium]|nr:hypothetical protein [Phycisphaerales bacterium]HMP37259.1 hypothetical protein [Phycisphaerales bacterium]
MTIGLRDRKIDLLERKIDLREDGLRPPLDVARGEPSRRPMP